MLQWFKQKIMDFQAKRRIARQIDPEVLSEMARELVELTQVAGQLGADEAEFVARMHRIRGEMEQLLELASKPEFRKLSEQRRLELRKSLIDSREQVLLSVQNAPTPTTVLQ